MEAHMVELTDPNGTPIEVLLVEDNPGDIRLTREALKDAKVLIHLNVAVDGGAAMEFLRREGVHANAPRPDLIFARFEPAEKRRQAGPRGDQEQP